jgi:2-iminobutanoate/2-iminopropanoate deaminase
MNFVDTKNAPSAIGPYSQAVIVDNRVYTSGQIALDVDGNMVGDDIKKQTVQVFNNLVNILEASNSKLCLVIKANIFLADMDDFAIVNEIYEKYFKDHKPARSTIAVKTYQKMH